MTQKFTLKSKYSFVMSDPYNSLSHPKINEWHKKNTFFLFYFKRTYRRVPRAIKLYLIHA